MTVSLRKTLLGAAAALTLLPAVASAATIVNGSFEQGGGAVALDGQAFSTLAAGTGNNSWSVFTALPGWTKISGDGIEIQTNNTLTTINAQDGQHYVELDSNNNSGMRQVVNFTSTGRYELTFWYSPRDSRTESNLIDYALTQVASPFTNLLNGTVTGPSGGPPVTAVGLWTEITLEFLITQTGNYNLDFIADGTNNSYGGFIDNVSVAAIPLPAGGLLLIGALGGLALLRRRKAA